MITNKDNLSAAIEKYVDREDRYFKSNLDIMINNAVDRVNKELKSLFFLKLYDFNMSSNVKEYSLPEDFATPINFKILIGEEKQILIIKDINFVQEFNSLTAPSVPAYYAIVLNKKIEVAPMPAIARQCFLMYKCRLKNDSNIDNAINSLIFAYPTIMLYASLIETVAFTKSLQDLKVYEELYKKALDEENKNSLLLKSDSYYNSLLY